MQTMQRVKVGVVGLAAVLLMIGLAATLFSIVNRERPGMAIGAPKPDVAANLASANAAAPENATSAPPLVQLGVAPDAAPSASAKK